MWNLHFHSSDLFYRMVKDYTTDTIMVEFGETHGQEFYSVYEIRCYRE